MSLPADSPVPPLLAPKPPHASAFRQFFAVCLNLVLWLFLAGGVVSLLDDSLVLAEKLHVFSVISAILSFVCLMVMVLLYLLMGFTPLVPKRIFIPIFILIGCGLLAMFPVNIYEFNRMLQLDWLLSILQILVVAAIVRRLLAGEKFRWLPIEARHLGERPFHWCRAVIFLFLNFLVLLACVGFLAICTGAAISHFTGGFLTLRPSGLILHARKYVRADGKSILLFPTSHIAEIELYQAIAKSATSNSIVLLEGVTDENNLLTNKLSYRRAAKTLGLTEQHDDLNIRQGTLVRADVDVHDFSSNTIAILNLVTLMHSRGINPQTLSVLLQCSPTPEMGQQLFSDLLLKRNEHLLKELHARLPESDDFVIPWGAAHMTGIAADVEKSGFHLAETREYFSIRFSRKPLPHNPPAGDAKFQN